MARILGFNINAVALLRRSQRPLNPDPVEVAAAATRAGAGLIIAYLREDRQLIQERDLRLLRQTLRAPLNLRMPPSQEMLKLAYDLKPDIVTLMPEQRQDASRYGLDLKRDAVQQHVHGLRDGDISVFAHIEPEIEQVKQCHRLGLSGLVLHADQYAQSRGRRSTAAALTQIADCARLAAKLDMSVAVSGGITYQNINALACIGDIGEFHSGQAIVGQAVLLGLDQAVRDMLARIN